MDTSSATTLLKPTSAERALRLSVIGRARTRPARRSGERSSNGAAFGASRLRDPRRDLSMFQLRPQRAADWRAHEVERLDPLLPPVISDPPQQRAVSSRVHVTARAATAGPRAEPTSLPAVELAVDSPARRRRRTRLTTRGYAAALGLLVGGVALCSAVTVGQADRTPSVESTQVVARGGESVEGLAERAAQGRDVQTVAESIRSANDLLMGEIPQAGEILVVPGS